MMATRSTLAIRSQLLLDAGFAHGFGTRLGGASAPPFDSLNLGRAVGDAADSVAENHRRLAAAIGYSEVFETTQVHGVSVAHITPASDSMALRAFSADAMVSRSPGIALGIRTADCIPILIADPRSGAVAAVHAGWRGVVGRVAERAIDALDVPTERLIVAIGPHIRAESFEVGLDVAEQIQAAAGDEPVIRRGRLLTVDLTRALTHQLRSVGVRAAQIDDVGGDTYSDSERFFSYRRDGGRSGRHLSVIVARAVAES